MSTRTQEIKNMRLISHVDLNGHNNLGEGVDLHQTASGRRIFYMAHEGPPKDFTSVDVTDLANPKVIAQTNLDYNHLRSNSLSIVRRHDAGGLPIAGAQPARRRHGSFRHKQSRSPQPYRVL